MLSNIKIRGIYIFYIFAFAGILLVSAFIRLYKLDQIPGGFYVDEATVGYNAYSILETGKDEYAKEYPVLFKFFGSFSPPLYVYLTAVAIKFTGLSVFSVRLISALSGILMVIIIGWFLKTSGIFKGRTLLLLYCVLIFSITPWAVFYSRAGYELNLGFMLFSLYCLFFYAGLHKKIFLTAGFIILGLSIYGAHAQLYLAIIFLVGYVFLFKREIYNGNSIPYLISGILFLFLITFPFIQLSFTPAVLTKSSLFYLDQIDLQGHKMSNIFPFFVGFIISFIREFSSRALTFFSPNSLFLLGDPDLQRSVPDLSVYFSWMVIPYLFGFYSLFKNIKLQFYRYICLLLIICVIPATLTKDPFSTQRNLPFLLPSFLLICLGIRGLYEAVTKKGFFWVVSGLFLILSFLILWRSYFVLFPKERALDWGYGTYQLAQEIGRDYNTKFVIDQSRKKPLYIQLLFFLKFPPGEYQKTLNKSERYYFDTQFNQNVSFGNIEFREVKWERDVYQEQIIVGDELTVSESQAKEHYLTKIFEIRDPIDRIVYLGYKTNPKQKCFATSNSSPACR